MLELLQTGRPPMCRGSQPHWRCALQKAAGDVLAERERNMGREACLPPQADPQIRQATSNDVSEPSRYMPPNSQSPLPCWSCESDDVELPVEVVDPEASPNRDAPSGVAEHTARLTPTTEQYELLAWIANAVHQAPPDQLQEQADVSRNNASQTARVLTMTSEEKNCWTHSFRTFSGRGRKTSAANFRKDTASGPLRCGRVRMSWTCYSPS